MGPLEKLDSFLKVYHSYYTINDVVISPVPGYLRTTKPCRCNAWYCSGGVYHTISIRGVGYPERDERGRFISPYCLWVELHDYLPIPKKV